ncbi:hypothetical protein EVAR_69133_1 [Eumeta japonica]|uniref:Uncharacterized protein n=1 Tax=Eumeta variegata TaxID=151549 RepID=A0A4C1SFB2_EUMVA|nr:hypothetical protein EVAR_69133_1 [Eumeta japonica]
MACLGSKIDSNAGTANGITLLRRDAPPAAALDSRGLTSEGTVIVRIVAIHKLPNTISHAMVEIMRYTVSCVFHTDNGEDVIGRFFKRAVAARGNKIKGNNAKWPFRMGTRQS